MLRFIKYKSLQLRRRYPRSKETFLSRMMHSELVLWDQSTASRGVAIGMFWAFIPIPFQMVPATLFCWLVRGNLPVALLCVWITNPLTLPPILLLEYRIGDLLLTMLSSVPAVTEPVVEGSNTYNIFAGGLRNILAGGLLMSCFAMVFGYLAILLSFSLQHKAQARRRRRQQQAATTTQPDD